MPSSKQARNALITCPSCDCILSSSDLEKHKSICSIDLPFPGTSASVMKQTSSHGFISSGVLLGIVEDCSKSEEAKGMTGWLMENVVFVHPDTMKLLGLNFQGPCLVTLDGNITIGTSWPSESVGRTAIGRAKERKNKGLGAVTRTEGWKRIGKVGLRPVNEWKSYFETEEFINFLQKYLGDSYWHPSLKLSLRYYGQVIEFEIVGVEEGEEEGNGDVEAMAKLNLNDSESESGQLDISSSSRSTCSTPNTSTPSRRTPNSGGIVNSASKSTDTELTIPDVPNQGLKSGVLRFTTRTEYWITQSGEPKEGNKYSFADFGGLARVKDELNRYLIGPVRTWNCEKGNGNGIRNILMHGSTGVGKSLMLSVISDQLRPIRVLVLSPAELISVKNEWIGPVVILVDDLDTVGGESSMKIASELCNRVDRLPNNVWLVAAVKNLDRVDISLRRRFDVELELTVPTAMERREILGIMVKRLKREVKEEVRNEIADAAHGYTGSDLGSVCKVAETLEGNYGARLWEALTKVRPSAMREIVLEVPRVRWEEVGGEEELKLKLRQAVEWPLVHGEAFRRMGMRPPRGVLLYGPPGCAKTMLARAVATETRLNFIAVKGPELFSKWVGESERAIRELFARARRAAPSVIFFDEIDALAVVRGESGGKVGDRVLAQLLTEMDGLETLGGVTIIAATNRPDLIDPALLRPGRLDRVIYVPLPNEETRSAVLKLRLASMPVSKDLDLEGLVRKTEGYSGAEIVALCNEAALYGMRECVEIREIGVKHFEMALELVKPRMDKKYLELYRTFQRTAGKEEKAGKSETG